jgi:hypothetical protein
MAEQPKAQGTRAYATACPLPQDDRGGLVCPKNSMSAGVDTGSVLGNGPLMVGAISSV